MGMQNYTVQKKIGTGSYGSAYLVTKNENKGRNDTKLVLKRINIKDATKEEKQAAHFEAKILKEFTHPYVLSCKDSFQHGPYMCIITDYCEAGDLYERLKKQSQKGQYLDEKHILRWLVQISTALQYVHEKNLLHRDLKTQNIFLTGKGDIMLGDFGIARVLKSKKDMARTVIGTPYYMSPEIVGNKPYSYKSDLWSLGCILFEMMSLKHAFDANDMNGLIMKIMRGKIPPLPNKYSNELKQLTTALLCKIPSRRPSLESILKMKFLQSTVKGVQAAIVQYSEKHVSNVNGYANGLLNNGHQVRVDKSIPDMRKQLQIQMQKQNVDPRPKSREKQMIDPRKIRAKPQAANVPKQRIQPKQIQRQEPSLDIAVDIAEQRLKNIHKEFRAVRVQAKKLEEAVNLSEDEVRVQKLRQKDVNRHHQYANPSNQNKAQGRAKTPERRRRSGGPEFNHHREEPRRRSAGSDMNQHHREEPRRRSAGSDMNQHHREEPRRRSAGSDMNQHHREEPRRRSAGSDMNPKERAKDARMQRKLEENRKYEQQLEEARKSYFKEKKAAMQKKQDLYKESTPPRPRSAQARYEDDVNEVRNLMDYGDYGEAPLQPIQEQWDDALEAKRRYEEQLEEARRSYYQEKKAALEKKQDMYRESSPPSSSEPPQYHGHGNVDYGDHKNDFVVQEEMVYGNGNGGHNAADYDNGNYEFQVEESFVYNAIPEENEDNEDIDAGVFAQGEVVDKVNAIRDYCLEKLGSVLFHELCGLIKLHNSRALTSTSDVEYAGEILERLGEKRIHFAGLIDHLLYLEEQLY